MKTKEITDIDLSQKYEGYLWWIDATSPKVYQKQQLPEWPDEKANPFIIEGQLYDEANRKSFSIRFVDGKYIICKYDLEKMEVEKQEKKFETIVKKYLPNRFPNNIQKLCFKEFWRPQKDEFCDGMEVLQPAEVVFVGFKTEED